MRPCRVPGKSAPVGMEIHGVSLQNHLEMMGSAWICEVWGK